MFRYFFFSVVLFGFASVSLAHPASDCPSAQAVAEGLNNLMKNASGSKVIGKGLKIGDGDWILTDVHGRLHRPISLSDFKSVSTEDVDSLTEANKELKRYGELGRKICGYWQVIEQSGFNYDGLAYVMIVSAKH